LTSGEIGRFHILQDTDSTFFGQCFFFAFFHDKACHRFSPLQPKRNVQSRGEGILPTGEMPLTKEPYAHFIR
jgi:hypothetical protein